MLVNKTVSVSKEASELGDGLVKIVSEVKKALADGFQAIPDTAAIGAAVYQDLIPAVQGIDKMPDEYKENKAAFMRAWTLAGLDMAEALGLK